MKYNNLCLFEEADCEAGGVLELVDLRNCAGKLIIFLTSPIDVYKSAYEAFPGKCFSRMARFITVLTFL